MKEPKNISFADLQNEELFPRQSSLVTIQCSGTRRIEQINEYAGEGDEMINAPWAEGAIGTAQWTGVSLKKVIKYCGGLVDGAKHLELYGAETYFKHVGYSFPFLPYLNTTAHLILLTRGKYSWKSRTILSQCPGLKSSSTKFSSLGK